MKFNTSPLQNLSTKLHFPILYLLSEKLNKSSGGFIPESFNKIHWKSTMLKFILILVVVNIVKELDLCFTFCSKNPQKKQIVFGQPKKYFWDEKSSESCPPVTIIWRQPFSRECKSGILFDNQLFTKTYFIIQWWFFFTKMCFTGWVVPMPLSQKTNLSKIWFSSSLLHSVMLYFL